jgi:hypothetical protein
MIAALEFLVDRTVNNDIGVFFSYEVIIETPAFVKTTRIHTSVTHEIILEETKLLSLWVQMAEGVYKSKIKHPLK